LELATKARHPISAQNRSRQNAADGGTADLQAACDFGFGHASTVQFPDRSGLEACGYGPTEPFTVLPGVGQSSPSSFAQYLFLKLCEDSQKNGHRSAGWRSQIQCLGERDETDAEMFQLLECRQQIRHRPTPPVQSPHQHDIDVATACGFDQSFTCFSLCRTGANFTYLYGDRPSTPDNIFPHGAMLHRQRLLISGGTAGAATGDYDTNNVYIVLNNGVKQQVAYNSGLNPFRNQYRSGPFNSVMDSSIRKTFKFTESG
jgi:hypothetical protein